MAVGAGSSMAFGYVVEEHTPIGDGHYSKRDAAIDGVMGAVGVGGVFKVANTSRRAYKFHRAAKRAEKAGDKTIAIRSGIKYNDDVLVAGVKIARDDQAIRAGLHGGAMIAGELAKGSRGKSGQPTTVDFAKFLYKQSLTLFDSVLFSAGTDDCEHD